MIAYHMYFASKSNDQSFAKDPLCNAIPNLGSKEFGRNNDELISYPLKSPIQFTQIQG